MNENNPLVAELTARANGTPAADAAAAARAGSRGLGDLPGRTTIAVVASVLAVVAIAATSWGLSRHDGKESAAPNSPESSEITFGPNQPVTTPTAGPTLPEASTPGFPSTDLFSPTYPTASAPALPGYTTPTYSYPTSTTPYSPYTPPTTTPTSPTTSPTKSPTRVTPSAPTATKITRCGTYGSVKVTKTDGVRYELTVGNGRQGRWVLRATARKGYVMTSGATTRWSGNLGKYYKCPSIKKVTVATDGATDQWRVTVSTAVSERDKRKLSVVYEFDTDVTVASYGGAGWTCTGPVGDGPDDGPFECTFAPVGQQPPPVFLSVGTPVAPSGTVTLYANDDRVDVARFSD